MTNIVQFAYWNVMKKRKTMMVEVDGTMQKMPATHMYKFRPVYILMVATVLVCLQPVCMLIIGSWICKGNYTTDQIDTTQMGQYNATAKCFMSLERSDCVGSYDPYGNFVLTKAYKADQDTLVPFGNGLGFPDGCSANMKNFFFDGGESNALVPNTTVGWMIQIFGTYLGFLLMFIGVCQATLLHVKIMKKWSELRA
jgi:hypothetical protein